MDYGDSALPGCPGLHPAQGYTLRYGYVPLSGEWITVILPCPAVQGYTLRYGYVPPSGEWVTEILPRVEPCDMGIIPLQGKGLWERIYRNFDSLEFYKRLINS
jgi:hypothetical protein